ncbi:MAG: hypothetical protein WD341_13980 [Tistlia sp.]|uniref:hypothetical protein n=1 Tax=Tistlia sp. TaxID=3057121 RepID=UPI0034A42324
MGTSEPLRPPSLPAARTVRPKAVRRVEPGALESPHLRALVAWYEDARGADGGWPPRDAFRPEALPPATLPHVGMVEIEPEPFRVLYRVLGSALTALIGGQAVSLRYLDELDWPQRAYFETTWRDAYAQPTPLFLRGLQTIREISFDFEFCALPIGTPTDSRRRYIIGEDYLDLEAWRRAAALSSGRPI